MISLRNSHGFLEEIPLGFLIEPQLVRPKGVPQESQLTSLSNPQGIPILSYRMSQGIPIYVRWNSAYSIWYHIVYST